MRRLTHRLYSTLAFTTMTKNNNSNNIIRPTLRGIIFDMDGTLTKPNLDFDEMYRRCGVSPTDDILTAIASLPPPKATAARQIIEEMEEEGRQTLEIAPGALELGRWIEGHGIPMALVTRNTEKTVDWMVQRLWKPSGGVPLFRPAISRDDDIPHKPDPSSLRVIATEWGMASPTRELLMVGDSLENDVVFGKKGGVSTALVGSSVDDGGDDDRRPDIHVDNLSTLPQRLWETFIIDGPLGTNTPLKKYPAPTPQTKAAIAATTGDIDTITALSPTERNARDEWGNTPLIWAADAGRCDAVKALLQSNDIDINARGYLGATAACRASRRGYCDILRLLASHDDVDWDIPNEKMQYPLHFAAFKLHAAAVDVLLDCGANTRVLDRKGRTPAEDTSDEGIRGCILKAREEKEALKIL